MKEGVSVSPYPNYKYHALQLDIWTIITSNQDLPLIVFYSIVAFYLRKRGYHFLWDKGVMESTEVAFLRPPLLGVRKFYSLLHFQEQLK